MAKKPPKAAPLTADGGTEQAPSKYQAFSVERINRMTLQGAPYNPRVIDDHAKKMLRENLRRVGLVAPVTVNKRTMHIVGGHQRIASLDALEGRQDYVIDVAFVDLDEKQEREQNVFLNNPNVMGQFDPEGLAEMLKAGLDLDAAGLDAIQVEEFLPDLVGVLPQFQGAAKETMEATEADLEAAEQAGKTARPAKPGPSPEERMADAMAQKARMRQEKTEDDTERYAVVLFKDRAERDAFVARVGGPPGERYLMGQRVLDCLKPV